VVATGQVQDAVTGVFQLILQSHRRENRFNGAGHNYDGAGANASDNNTLRVFTWFAYGAASPSLPDLALQPPPHRQPRFPCNFIAASGPIAPLAAMT
jgi:hypothetical protein